MTAFPKLGSRSDSSGFTIAAMYNHAPTKGDVGIEIEVEGNMFPKHEYRGEEAVDAHLIPKAWKYVHDGSLRGKDNAEYVLNGPIDFDDVPATVQSLFSMMDDYGTVLDDSNRTSVHVHLNVQNWHINRLASFLCAYYAVEEILSEFCGEHRVGNLFCLRGKDAPGIISRLRYFIKRGESVAFTDGMHYGGLNCQAIQKYGSVEIRTMRGAMNAEEVITWVGILRRIYDLSAEYADPRLLVELFSGSGPMEFLEHILGEYRTTVLSAISYDHQRIMEALYDGIVIAQDIAYCRSWEDFKPLNIKPDPFGRSMKTIASQMMSADVDYMPSPNMPMAAPAHSLSAPLSFTEFAAGYNSVQISLSDPLAGHELPDWDADIFDEED
jgi:hypothetical protein